MGKDQCRGSGVRFHAQMQSSSCIHPQPPTPLPHGHIHTYTHTNAHTLPTQCEPGICKHLAVMLLCCAVENVTSLSAIQPLAATVQDQAAPSLLHLNWLPQPSFMFVCVTDLHNSTLFIIIILLMLCVFTGQGWQPRKKRTTRQCCEYNSSLYGGIAHCHCLSTVDCEQWRLRVIYHQLQDENLLTSVWVQYEHVWVPVCVCPCVCESVCVCSGSQRNPKFVVVLTGPKSVNLLNRWIEASSYCFPPCIQFENSLIHFVLFVKIQL